MLQRREERYPVDSGGSHGGIYKELQEDVA